MRKAEREETATGQRRPMSSGDGAALANIHPGRLLKVVDHGGIEVKGDSEMKGNGGKLGDSRIIPSHLPLSPLITPASPVISHVSGSSIADIRTIATGPKNGCRTWIGARSALGGILFRGMRGG